MKDKITRICTNLGLLKKFKILFMLDFMSDEKMTAIRDGLYRSPYSNIVWKLLLKVP